MMQCNPIYFCLCKYVTVNLNFSMPSMSDINQNSKYIKTMYPDMSRAGV